MKIKGVIEDLNFFKKVKRKEEKKKNDRKNSKRLQPWN